MSASSGRWAPAAVVFDCDGTLVDSATANYQAWRDALRPAGVALDQAWYLDRTGLSATQLLDHLEAEHRRCLDRRGVHDVDPYHALALDDTAEGLTAARRAGLRTVDVRNRHALTAASRLLQQRP
jgi:beta-phosphoglucomutase-like phosphatase (HAD superfamily)